MDPYGRIYRSDDVPPEDKARLDGYLRGREEAELLAKERAEELERKLAEAEDRQG